VRERRLALGLSQVELAARADMTQPALSRLEAGGPKSLISVLTGGGSPTGLPGTAARSHRGPASRAQDRALPPHPAHILPPK